MSDTGGAAGEQDWAGETAGRLEEIVTKIRSQTTDRVVKVARVVVYGLLAAVMGLMLAIVALIGLLRGLDELVPQEIWLVYIPVGAILTGAGLLSWRKARKPSPEKV